jgi:hypothetical protein
MGLGGVGIGGVATSALTLLVLLAGHSVVSGADDRWMNDL